MYRTTSDARKATKIAVLEIEQAGRRVGTARCPICRSVMVAVMTAHGPEIVCDCTTRPESCCGGASRSVSFEDQAAEEEAEDRRWRDGPLS